MIIKKEREKEERNHITKFILQPHNCTTSIQTVAVLAEDITKHKPMLRVGLCGKLFTSVINNRLVEYFDENITIGPKQSGFRAGHSTVDHVFTLHCIIDFFLAKKKRLYCLFIDYEKAFDRVERAFLWQKFLDSVVDGRILTIIKDMYRKAKSCVKTGNVCSDYFDCYSGVRQGGICHLYFLQSI